MSALAIAAFAGAAVLLICALGGVLGARLVRRSSAPASVGDESAPALQMKSSGFALPLQTLLRQAGLRQSVGQLYAVLIAASVAGFMLLWYLHMPWLLCGLGAVGGFFMVPLVLKLKKAQRHQVFIEQLPSALELMANALRAGLGVNSAMGITAQEISDPLGAEFSQMVAELNLGTALETALEHLVQRNPSNDVRLLAQAITIHKQVGGNLAEVLDNLDKTIRERFYLQRELRSMTVEQQMSAWVLGLLPVVMAILITLANPEYMQILTKTKDGHYVLSAAIVLQVVGVLWLRMILKVDF